jgi:2-C-methyl-D-erythritol 4-phosphate cytidylyltransferase/2-C-methyl-D-erythritol 2,4-cyclodiphosphate synthase
MKIFAIIVASGSGSRFAASNSSSASDAAIPKQYLQLGSKMVCQYAIQAFANCKEIAGIIMVTNPQHHNFYQEIEDVSFCAGGESRQKSVYNGLRKAAELGADAVLIHDAARPFITSEIITNVADKLKTGIRAVDVGVAIADTVKSKDPIAVLDRNNLYATQTPQGFALDYILRLHQLADENGREYTDDISMAIAAGDQIEVVQGSKHNFKITMPEDMQYAEFLLAA